MEGEVVEHDDCFEFPRKKDSGHQGALQDRDAAFAQYHEQMEADVQMIDLGLMELVEAMVVAPEGHVQNQNYLVQLERAVWAAGSQEVKE